MKLQVGCGARRLPDYINTDKHSPHVLHLDIESIPWVLDNEVVEADSLSEGRMDMVLEHIARQHIPGILAECHRVLEPGGTLRIIVPDLIWICHRVLQDGLNEALASGLWGGQHAPGHYHKHGFTQHTLTRLIHDVAKWASVSVKPKSTGCRVQGLVLEAVK